MHTPGPWYVVGNEVRSIVVDVTEVVAQKVAPADAILIAAAPDLLAALKVSLAQLETLGGKRRKHPKEGQDGLHADVLECIDAAIAKAQA